MKPLEYLPNGKCCIYNICIVVVRRLIFIYCIIINQYSFHQKYANDIQCRPGGFCGPVQNLAEPDKII